LRWDEVPDVEPEALTLATVPRRYKKLGDVWGKMDAQAFTLDSLLQLSERQKAAGLGEAPFPPHFEKQKDEPLRAPPRAGALRAKPALAARAKRQPRRGGSR
ncbi:MAG TPA: ATP-dependent DNA ligase, partial [Archangium sp.]|nr:ATP-dependent DNA ligase [Archangium sp.]